MLWAVFFGYLIWNTLPDLWGWIGAGLITIGGLLANKTKESETLV
jgi:drug/metabolite transporter (DMT)-like permease